MRPTLGLAVLTASLGFATTTRAQSEALSASPDPASCLALQQLHALDKDLLLATAAASRERSLLKRASDPRQLLTVGERQTLLTTWQQFFAAWEQLQHLGEDQPAGSEGVDSRRRALQLTAQVSAQLHGRRMAERLGQAGTLGMLLDETPAGQRARRGSHGLFRRQLEHEPALSELVHFAKYELPATRGWAERPGCDVRAEQAWLAGFWRRQGAHYLASLARPTTLPRARGRVADHTEQSLAALQSAVVTPVAIFLGRTKVRQGHRRAIQVEQIHAMLPALQPGDLVLEKTDWYLSNLFIDGFWGHAALHLGTLDEAAAFFATPEVEAYLARLGCADFASCVQTRYPEATRAWQQRDAQGDLPRVLEGDGVEAPQVFFNTAERAYLSDHVAVLRPRGLDRVSTLQAVLDALSYFGTPYDFDFDARTDSALVCTELVAKAYASGPHKMGLHLDLDPATGGRTIVYPNRIAERFARERRTAQAQLDFVYFLNADPASGRAVVASEQDFAASHAWRSML